MKHSSRPNIPSRSGVMTFVINLDLIDHMSVGGHSDKHSVKKDFLDFMQVTTIKLKRKKFWTYGYI